MPPSKNKQIKLDEFSMENSLSHVHIVEGDIPEPKQGEVLVNVYLRPVNPTDLILIKTGWGGAVPLPSNPGSDGEVDLVCKPLLTPLGRLLSTHFSLGVGKVVRNGPGAKMYKEGQRVSAAPWPQFQGKGSWAQYVCVPEKDLVGQLASLDACEFLQCMQGSCSCLQQFSPACYDADLYTLYRCKAFNNVVCCCRCLCQRA